MYRRRRRRVARGRRGLYDALLNPQFGLDTKIGRAHV